MNWTGGARSRLRMQKDKKKQKEFFERQRYAKKATRRVPFSPHQRKAVSQDILSLHMISRAFDECMPLAAVNPESVVKVNMDRTAQPGSLSRKCVNDVDLGPMSPINRPSTLLLMDSKSESRQQPDKWRSNSQPQSVLRVNNRESNFKPYEDRAFLSLRNSGTGALPLPIPDPRPKYEDIETPFQIRSAFPTDHLTHQLSSFSQAGPMQQFGHSLKKSWRPEKQYDHETPFIPAGDRWEDRMDEDRYEKIKRRHEDFQKWISDKRKSNGNVFSLPKHPDLIRKERKFSLYENKQRHTEKPKSKNIAETDYISTSKFKSKNKKHFWEEATPFLIGHKDCTQPDEFFRANSPTKSIPDDAASVGSEIVGKFSLGLDGDSQDLEEFEDEEVLPKSLRPTKNYTHTITRDHQTTGAVDVKEQTDNINDDKLNNLTQIRSVPKSSIGFAKPTVNQLEETSHVEETAQPSRKSRPTSPDEKMLKHLRHQRMTSNYKSHLLRLLDPQSKKEEQFESRNQCKNISPCKANDISTKKKRYSGAVENSEDLQVMEEKKDTGRPNPAGNSTVKPSVPAKEIMDMPTQKLRHDEDKNPQKQRETNDLKEKKEVESINHVLASEDVPHIHMIKDKWCGSESVGGSNDTEAGSMETIEPGNSGDSSISSSRNSSSSNESDKTIMSPKITIVLSPSPPACLHYENTDVRSPCDEPINRVVTAEEMEGEESLDKHPLAVIPSVEIPIISRDQGVSTISPQLKSSGIQATKETMDKELSCVIIDTDRVPICVHKFCETDVVSFTDGIVQTDLSPTTRRPIMCDVALSPIGDSINNITEYDPDKMIELEKSDDLNGEVFIRLSLVNMPDSVQSNYVVSDDLDMCCVPLSKNTTSTQEHIEQRDASIIKNTNLFNNLSNAYTNFDITKDDILGENETLQPRNEIVLPIVDNIIPDLSEVKSSQKKEVSDKSFQLIVINMEVDEEPTEIVNDAEVYDQTVPESQGSPIPVNDGREPDLIEE